jgi:acid stress-induced BolA-like protein IbaG/YrbA
MKKIIKTIGRVDRNHLKVITVCSTAAEFAVLDKNKEILANVTVYLENEDFYIVDVKTYTDVRFDAREVVMRVLNALRLREIIENECDLYSFKDRYTRRFNVFGI